MGSDLKEKKEGGPRGVFGPVVSSRDHTEISPVFNLTKPGLYKFQK